ncbi:MAG: carboxypeptidase-like regulatory domain-containing protein [Chloroflexota bacterium]
MTPRGVCRIVLVALILFGPGLESLLNTSYLNVPTALAATIPVSSTVNSTAAAPRAAPINCTSSSGSTLGAFSGLSGTVVDDASPVNYLRGITVTVVDSNDQPINIGTANPVKTNSFSPSLYGTFAFNNIIDVSLLKNFTLKFEGDGMLTHYYGQRYDIASAVKLTATNQTAGQPCTFNDSTGQSINTYSPNIVMYAPGGIAGRVTVAFPPSQLPNPIVDESIPISGATVTAFYYDPVSKIISTTIKKTVTTDKDGYYLMAGLGSSAIGVDETYVIRFTHSNNKYLPLAGSYWRDGNLPYPYSQYPSYYALQPITVTNASISAGTNNYISQINSSPGYAGSYSGVAGINGHMVVPATISGKLYDGTIPSTPFSILNGYVQIYDITGTTLIATSAQTPADGSYSVTNLNPNTSYRIKAIPPNGSALIPRWYPSAPFSGTVVTTPIPDINGDSNSPNKDITLVPGRKFTGNVTAVLGGGGIGQVRVQVFNASDTGPNAVPIDDSATTDSFGHYATKAMLEDGASYRLSFLPEGASADYIAAFCGGASGGTLPLNTCTKVYTLDSSSVFTISADVTADVQLDIGTRISGTITADSSVTDLLASDARVQAYVSGATNGLVYQSFQINPVAAGTSMTYTTAALPPNLSIGGSVDGYKLQFVPQTSISNTGFLPRYYLSGTLTGTANLNAATIFNIVLNASNITANFKLTQGGEISLHLRYEDPVFLGQFITATNMQIAIYANSSSSANGNQWTVGSTDQNGNITFRGLPTSDTSYSNPYALLVMPTGSFLPTWVTSTSAIKGLFQLTNGSGINLPLNLTFDLKQGGVISGTITDVGGANFDFGKTRISVYDSGKNFLFLISGTNYIKQNSQTNTWYYQVTLVPGSYYMGFDSQVITNYLPLFYPDSSYLVSPIGQQHGPAPSLIPVTNQNLANPIINNIVFTPRGYVRVNVIDTPVNNNPVGGASIVIYQADKTTLGLGPGYDGVTDYSGIYTGSYLTDAHPAGANYTYYAKATSSGPGGATGYYGGNDLASALPFTITVLSTKVITISIGQLTIVTGTVMVHPSSGSDRPQAGVVVTAIDATTGQQLGNTTTTDSTGFYQLSSFFSNNFWVKFEYQFNLNSAVNTKSTLYYNNKIALNGSTPNVDITFNQGASVGGQVKGLNSGTTNLSEAFLCSTYSVCGIIGGLKSSATTPLANINIQLIDVATETTVFAGATTDGNGYYSMPNIAPGNYKIKFQYQGNTLKAYYVVNRTDGTNTFSFASSTNLPNGVPIGVNQTFDLAPPVAGTPCTINAVPVNATTSGFAVSFSGSCAGIGRVYYGLPNTALVDTTNLVNTTVIVDSNQSQDHLIVIPGPYPALNIDTNYYFKASIMSGTVEYFSNLIMARTAAGGNKWYFAEGDTRNSSTLSNTEILHVFNYGSTWASVWIGYYFTTTTGISVVNRTVNVTPTTRLDIDVGKYSDSYSLNGHPSAKAISVTGTTHSTFITSNVAILVERSTYNLTNGMSNGKATAGGSVIAGTTSPSDSWFFPEGIITPTTGSSYETYFTVFNPSPAVTVNILAYFYGSNSSEFAMDFISLNPKERKVIKPSLPSSTQNGFSTELRSIGAGTNLPTFVAEQHILYNNGLPDESYRKGESNMFGAISKGQQWYFLEGLTDKVTSRDYLILNPEGTTANLTITMQLDNPPAGSTNPTVTYTSVPPQSRLVIPVTDPNARMIGRTFGFTVKVESNSPIIVQRAIRFNWRTQPVIDGTFSQLAIARLASTWIFAAGSTATTNKVADLAYNLYNPNTTPVRLKFTYYFSDGSTPTSITGFYLNANARTRIQPGSRIFPGYPSVGPDKNAVSVKIESVDSSDVPITTRPIFAERILYWSWNSYINTGNATFGYNPPGT